MEPTQNDGAHGVEPRATPAGIAPDATHGSHVIQEPPVLAKRLALLGVFLVVAVLGGAIAVRMQGAMGEQAQLTADREAAATRASEAPEVDVAHPAAAQLTPLVVMSGALEPAQSADVGFEVPGRIARVEVSLGQHVRAGEI
ncbi:MAG: hypothetical protein ACK5U8_10940, partial [Deltaproteobacteria bacterium]